jgi:hypothetical protein
VEWIQELRSVTPLARLLVALLDGGANDTARGELDDEEQEYVLATVRCPWRQDTAVEDDKRFTLHYVCYLSRRGLHRLDFAHILRKLVFDQNNLSMQDETGCTPLHRICDPFAGRAGILPHSFKREAREYDPAVNDDVAAAKTHVQLLCQVVEKKFNLENDFLEIMARTRNLRSELPLHLVVGKHLKQDKLENSSFLTQLYPEGACKLDPMLRVYPFMCSAIGKYPCVSATFSLLLSLVAQQDMNWYVRQTITPSRKRIPERGALPEGNAISSGTRSKTAGYSMQHTVDPCT